MVSNQYIDTDSFCHKLNPKIKLLINIIFIVLIFIIKSFILQFIVLFLLILTFIFLAKLRIIKLVKLLYSPLFIGIFLFFINSFILKQSDDIAGNKTYVDFGGFLISDLVFYNTFIVIIRIYIMIICTHILISTTRSIALTNAIEGVLSPLKLFFIPVNIISMIISIALRFIPTLFSETSRIMKAQSSRGVDFKNGNLKTKAKSLITLIIPLFVSAFIKAEDLGNAMETRGYDPYQKRTKYRIFKITWRDFIAAFFIITIIVLTALNIHEIINIPRFLNI